MACKHSICGVCGGKKVHTKYIGIGTTLNDICSVKCQAALKDECSCKCEGKFHKGANKDLMNWLITSTTPKNNKGKKVIFQPITMFDYLAEFLNGKRILTKSFDRYSDKTYRKENKKITLNWLSNKGTPIDTLANDFINETGFTNYQEEDIIYAIVNYINDYPSGIKKYIEDTEAERIREENFYNEPFVFGIKNNKMKLKKGSAAAKAYMAKIRAKKAKTTPKKVGKTTTKKVVKTTSKKVGYYGDGKIVNLSDLKPNNVFEWIMGAEYLEVIYLGKTKEFPHIKIGTKVGINPVYLFQFLKGSDFVALSIPAIKKYLRTIPKVGAVKKPMQSKHKDTKSHNVNIRVVSGVKTKIGAIDLNIIGKELWKLETDINELKSFIRAEKLIKEKNKLREILKVKQNQYKTLAAYLNSIARFKR